MTAKTQCTVCASAKPDVQDDIAGQEEHHRQGTFREEYIRMLQKSGIEYEERYLD